MKNVWVSEPVFSIKKVLPAWAPRAVRGGGRRGGEVPALVRRAARGLPGPDERPARALRPARLRGDGGLEGEALPCPSHEPLS